MYHVSRAGVGGGAGAGPGAAARTGRTIGGATHKRARVPVKSNPAAFLAAIKWASIASEFCADAIATHKLEIRKSAALSLAARIFMDAAPPSFLDPNGMLVSPTWILLVLVFQADE